jgi:HEAT repeat protein
MVNPLKAIGRFDYSRAIGRLRGKIWSWAVFPLLVVGPGCQSESNRVPLQDANKSVAECRAMLTNTDVEVQARGALGLSLHGTAAQEAGPELIALLASPNSLVRQNAALALGMIRHEIAATVPALVKGLADREWTVRRQSVLALSAIGPEAKAAVPALRKLETDPHPTVRSAAKTAIANIDKK